MSCIECQENLVAYLEGVLDASAAAECERHLEQCPACRGAREATLKLQQRLLRRGQAASGVSLVAPVMSRIREFEPSQGEKNNRERSNLMKRLLSGWGLGLSAATGVAAIILVALLVSPNTRVSAAEVMARGAKAVARLGSIHFRGQLRTLPADNFSYIDADRDFATVELWKQFEPALKWRVEKPGRVAVMDGQSTVLYFKHANEGVKFPNPSRSAFDTEWLHRIANLSNTISNELKNAQAQGWKLDLAEETAADGRVKSLVTIHARSGVPENDYLRNKFLTEADTRRVYRFDAQSEVLESVQFYLIRPSGEVLLFDLGQIDYNQPIDPGVWHLDLPADVSWSQEVQKLPDNEKYASLSAEQAARAFFEACAREDWAEVGKFMSPVSERLKRYLGGLEIISLGESFGSQAYPGRLVPYEIRLRPQQFNVRVSNANPGKRYVITGVYDDKLQLQQDLKWTNEPALLPDNDAYARLSPAEAVKAYFDAASKLDWDEMRKFAPGYDVESDKAQIEAAAKQGIDVRKLMPTREAGEAFWSAEQSAWFVKCRALQVKKWNLAVRNDNPAGRWQVDGGL